MTIPTQIAGTDILTNGWTSYSYEDDTHFYASDGVVAGVLYLDYDLEKYRFDTYHAESETWTAADAIWDSKEEAMRDIEEAYN